WDGLGTKRDVERATHERLARYFELLDAAEQTGLEAARAYYDVQRFRRLVQLAEDNYVQHKHATLQIQSRFKAGVGRGVDLEQANARFALAESNLGIETANLHDVMARYQAVALAANDIRKRKAQLDLLDRNALAIEKARDAYRQQFDIGQRSLLDLLNAENELYTAKRAYANAEFDLVTAYARTQAAMSQLLAQLGIARVDTATADVAASWSSDDDMPGRCPVVTAEVTATDRALLDERARRIAATVAPAASAPRKP